MRAVTALVVVLALAGCNGGPDQESVETTTTVATTTHVSTTTTTLQVTTTQVVPTTTGPVKKPENGAESIGVTDKVTIVVTDPEDG